MRDPVGDWTNNCAGVNRYSKVIVGLFKTQDQVAIMVGEPV
jgi:hypothetical protein